MPQGFKPKKSAPSTTKSSSGKTPAHRVIKPSKSSSLAKQQNATRKAAAGLTGVLEKRLAERAGHVEMVLGKGGRSEGRKARLERAGGGTITKGGEGKGVKKGPTGKSVG